MLKETIMAENNRPVYKYQLGTIECAVWAKQASDGKPYFQFSFQKTYKTKDGKYQHTTFFNKSDLAALAMLCERACLQEIAKQAVESRAAQDTPIEEDVPF